MLENGNYINQINMKLREKGKFYCLPIMKYLFYDWQFYKQSKTYFTKAIKFWMNITIIQFEYFIKKLLLF